MGPGDSPSQGGTGSRDEWAKPKPMTGVGEGGGAKAASWAKGLIVLVCVSLYLLPEPAGGP